MDEGLLALLHDDGEMKYDEFWYFMVLVMEEACIMDSHTGNMKDFILMQYEKMNEKWNVVSRNRMFTDLLLRYVSQNHLNVKMEW